MVRTGAGLGRARDVVEAERAAADGEGLARIGAVDGELIVVVEFRGDRHRSGADDQRGAAGDHGNDAVPLVDGLDADLLRKLASS